MLQIVEITKYVFFIRYCHRSERSERGGTHSFRRDILGCSFEFCARLVVFSHFPFLVLSGTVYFPGGNVCFSLELSDEIQNLKPSCSQDAFTFDFGIKLKYILTNLRVNLLTVKLYNLSLVLTFRLTYFSTEQFVPDVQTATVLERNLISLNQTLPNFLRNNICKRICHDPNNTLT